MRARIAILALVTALPCCIGTAIAAAAPASAAGETLYRHGLLPSGEPLTGLREGNVTVTGSDAACTSCHRRSGLGLTEGRITIPPVAGPYLFAPSGVSLEQLGIPLVDTARISHEPYTEATLARAIRDGVDANGRRLSYLMPRYQLDDASMAELIAYLKGMELRPAPGVTGAVLHFATIVTPDADPVKRDGMLAVMQQYFADKNNAMARTKAPTLYAAHRTMFRVERRWQLHVWQLSGAPGTWEAQLRQRLAAEPVFAVISGLSGSNWDPVHQFCEQQALPCLFPNVEAPPGRDDDFYSVYFTDGVILEAQLIAPQLADGVPGRIVQVFRERDVGEQAANALQAHVEGAARTVNRPLRPGATVQQLAAALEDIKADDALVLWLRPGDLRALASVPVRTSRVWISGEMGGLEYAPVPPAWRASLRMALPVDLPGRRVVRVDYALSWFRLRGIPLVAQRVQADTYLACGLVSETLNHMTDAFVRDYLIERIQMALDHRALTGYYPRLSLAPGQRFASKGGYIVRFSDAEGPRIAALGDWITP